MGSTSSTTLFAAGCALFAMAGSATAQEQPWRLQEAVGAPAWLTLRGEARMRYETLDGQFRANRAGGDQILAFRTLFLAEADAGPFALGLELQDSRASLDDVGTPLSTSIVNPLDILQAYARFDTGETFGFTRGTLTIGRQTVSIGSRRVIERVEFANVIFSYTGAHFIGTTARGDSLHALLVVPTGREPADRAALGEDRLSGDEEQWGRRFWGLHAIRRNALGAAAPGLTAEAFVYGLSEEDAADTPTPNRQYLQPGFRVYRRAEPGRFDFEVESAYRVGQRRATSAASDVTDLDVSAWMLYAHAGYTFDHAWRPRLSFDYYYASGDEDPQDGRFDQYERLFGSRRTDLGNTSLHGPLTPANLSAPGLRLEIAPHPRFDARLAYKHASLAQGRDAWVVAGVRDQSGLSGRFIGHALDGRLRYWLAPGNLQLEIGASALIAGRFAEEAPNAARQGDTTFGYVQLTQTF